jgi:fatty acid desaturase
MDELAELTAGAPRNFRESLAGGRISAAQIRGLCVVRGSRSVLDLATTLATFVAVPVLAWLAPHPLTYVFCVLLAIHNFNCLAQLVHESDHGSLFRRPGLNAVVGNLCAYPVGYNRYGHRQAHLDHHLYLNTERDPDLIWSRPEQSTRELLAAFVQDLLLLSAIKRFLQYFQPTRGAYSVSPWRSLSVRALAQMGRPLVPVLVTQTAIVALFALTAGPWFYLWLHVLPVMTLYPAQIRLRSTAEHSFADDWRPAEGVWVTRTTRPNVFEWFLFAPFGQYYHYEHHLFPGVPHYGLGAAHRLLVDAGIPVPVTTSYIGFLVRKVRSERALNWSDA